MRTVFAALLLPMLVGSCAADEGSRCASPKSAALHPGRETRVEVPIAFGYRPSSIDINGGYYSFPPMPMVTTAAGGTRAVREFDGVNGTLPGTAMLDSSGKILVTIGTRTFPLSGPLEHDCVVEG